MAFVTGATVAVACFVAGVSYSYRLIHLLLTVPWLLGRCREAGAVDGGVARLGLGLFLAVAWLDGLYALAGGGAVSNLAGAALLREVMFSRWVTQPVAWVLMALLTAWLLGVAVAAVKALAAKPAAALADDH